VRTGSAPRSSATRSDPPPACGRTVDQSWPRRYPAAAVGRSPARTTWKVSSQRSTCARGAGLEPATTSSKGRSESSIRRGPVRSPAVCPATCPAGGVLFRCAAGVWHPDKHLSTRRATGIESAAYRLGGGASVAASGLVRRPRRAPMTGVVPHRSHSAGLARPAGAVDLPGLHALPRDQRTRAWTMSPSRRTAPSGPLM